MSEATKPDDAIDEAIDESFPASDPPEWTGTHAGSPAPAPPASTSPAAELKTVRSGFTVDEAVTRLERALTAAGMKVFARIDHAGEARAAGLTMRPAVLLVFGNPSAGTPLMVARPTVAIDLPLKALLWQDEQGVTWLTYHTPAMLVRRHDLDPTLASTLEPVGALLERSLRS
jgi:uncharacterized protein (DUF302 family)